MFIIVLENPEYTRSSSLTNFLLLTVFFFIETYKKMKALESPENGVSFSCQYFQKKWKEYKSSRINTFSFVLLIRYFVWGVLTTFQDTLLQSTRQRQHKNFSYKNFLLLLFLKQLNTWWCSRWSCSFLYQKFLIESPPQIWISQAQMETK